MIGYCGKCGERMEYQPRYNADSSDAVWYGAEFEFVCPNKRYAHDGHACNAG